jgi:hypothetical protein
MRMAQLDIRAILAEHPRPHLHFNDNGCWTLYRDKESFERDDETLPGWERNALTLAEGDYGDSDGYLPSIVAALCAALGITANSI